MQQSREAMWPIRSGLVSFALMVSMGIPTMALADTKIDKTVMPAVPHDDLDGLRTIRCANDLLENHPNFQGATTNEICSCQDLIERRRERLNDTAASFREYASQLKHILASIPSDRNILPNGITRGIVE